MRIAGATLSLDHASLAFGVPASAPVTIFALSIGGGVVVGPGIGNSVVFGRNRPDVDVCVGEDDRKVSRQQGTLTYGRDRWWVTNTGRLPIRLPGSWLLFNGEEPMPLPEGYTPLFVQGSTDREHLLEVYVSGAEGERPRSRHRDLTQPPRSWRLNDDERLTLIVLGQRYLRHEANPQPLTWQQTADQLAELRPGKDWTAKGVGHLVADIRTRLSRGGVANLTREEVGEPVGNTLNHNLLRELLLSTTLVPPDLVVLDSILEE